jgi:phosphatidylserine/phosphatidylglycerophosphate/cardiolipin synthase-like enzyme
MKKYRYPRHRGDQYRLLVDGSRFFPAMERSIAAAQRYVLLEMYLFESGQVADRFIARLTAAAARGVRICLLLDGYGALDLHASDRQRLAVAGVELTFYNPLGVRRWFRNLLRNHRKLLLVDGRVAFTGGAGITDAFDPRLTPQGYWHDTMLEIRGASVGDWQHLFAETWNRWAEKPLAARPDFVTPGGPGNGVGRVALQSPVVAGSEVMRSYITHIRRARKRVWLATAYFVPPWKLRRALRQQARRGLDVRVLLPGPHSDHPVVKHMGSRYYQQLLRNGVRIFEYQPRFLHTKLLLCDGWVSTGSCNADGWNYRWSLEANQEGKEAVLAAQAEATFRADFAESREIFFHDWTNRSRATRWREWFWGRVVRWLTRLSDRDNGRRRTL